MKRILLPLVLTTAIIGCGGGGGDVQTGRTWTVSTHWPALRALDQAKSVVLSIRQDNANLVTKTVNRPSDGASITTTTLHIDLVQNGAYTVRAIAFDGTDGAGSEIDQADFDASSTSVTVDF